MQLAARLAMHKNAAAGESSSGAVKLADVNSSNGEEAELFQPAERPPERPRNPFADDDDDDDDDYDDDGVIDSDDDDEDRAAPPPSTLRSWSSRGAWWREVLTRTGKGPRNKGQGHSDGDGDDNDSIGDEEDETGSTGAEDDEEFGEFAMPKMTSAVEKSPARAGDSNASEEGSEEGDKEAEKVILKPLPVHPPTGKTGFGSLWPFGGEKKEEGEKTDVEKKPPGEEGIKPAIEAKKRTSIEEADEDEVMV